MLPRAAFLALAALVAASVPLACASTDEVGGFGDGNEGGGAPAECGDGKCSIGETCETCADDCCSPAVCGDGECVEPETCLDCPDDCGGCPSCGDRVCGDDETCSSCPMDCGSCAGFCGDGTCDPGETCQACQADCGECPVRCGDGMCTPEESCQSCPDDCGMCPPSCGNTICDAAETCTSCPSDCGACPPECGDGTCNGTETCSTCTVDCGACPPMCGDNVCGATESCSTCPDDCGLCPCAPDELEPNNGSPTASPVVSGVQYCGLNICTGDVDWLEFTVTSGLSATITFDHADGDLDLEIYSQQTLDYVDGSYGSDNDENVTLSGLAAGTYWARVYGPAGDTNPDYCFVVDTQ